MNHIAPEAMRQHFRLNQGRLLSSSEVAQEIQEYVEACEDGEQTINDVVGVRVSKSAPRGEQRKFAGQWNWCWRIGHEEAQCWFQQAYEKENGFFGAAPAADASRPNLPQ